MLRGLRQKAPEIDRRGSAVQWRRDVRALTGTNGPGYHVALSVEDVPDCRAGKAQVVCYCAGAVVQAPGRVEREIGPHDRNRNLAGYRRLHGIGR